MLTAKLVRLDTAWSATPQPRRRTAWPRRRRKRRYRRRSAVSRLPLRASRVSCHIPTPVAVMSHHGSAEAISQLSSCGRRAVRRRRTECWSAGAASRRRGRRTAARGSAGAARTAMTRSRHRSGRAWCRRQRARRSLPHAPAQPKVREGLGQLGEVDAVVAQVRPGAVGKRHRRARHRVADHLGDVADLYVVLRRARR